LQTQTNETPNDLQYRDPSLSFAAHQRTLKISESSLSLNQQNSDLLQIDKTKERRKKKKQSTIKQMQITHEGALYSHQTNHSSIYGVISSNSTFRLSLNGLVY
jgi:hypothetical protein